MSKKKQVQTKMDSNPAKVPWPTDKWGFTRELRKAVLSTAARLKGDTDKKALLDETLNVAIEFLEVNFESSYRDRQKAIKKSIAADEAAAEKNKADRAERKAQVTARTDGQDSTDEEQLKLFDLEDDE